MSHPFYFATCQVTAEKAVKEEWKTLFPNLNFAFSRPGFVTFKNVNPHRSVDFTTRPGVFTRLMGESVAQIKGDDTQNEQNIQPLLEKIPEKSILHVFERDLFFPGDEPPGEVRNSRIAQVVAALRAKSNFRINAAPRVGEKVFDLVWIDPGHWFLGVHVHSPDYDKAPGNIPSIPLPEVAPSRAYLKLVEAVHRFDVQWREAQEVLEVGCSPGGATHAMLSHGMTVTGVDPKEMATTVNEHPQFRLIQKMAKNVIASDLEECNPEWLVMDINLAPQTALEELTHIVNLLKKRWGSALKLKRGFLTLKMTDWKLLPEIPSYLKQIERMGFKKLVPLQLVSNRQEFMVVAER